tara:strand:- start:348 stop:1034 length:687 start_codon:yes stop_codon:yes gene_type:complete
MRGEKMLSFLFALATAGEPLMEITVESHQDFEVYVSPTKIINNTEISYELDETSVFGHTVDDVKWIQKKGLYGYETIDEDVFVYNQDTIKYAWLDCDYSKDAKKCAYDNGHYILESYITFNKEQVTVRLILFDENLVPVAQATSTNTRVVKVTPREKTTRQVGQAFGGQQRQCDTTSCSIQPNRIGGSTYAQTIKEDLEPSVVIIEPKLLDKDIKQASMRLWTSVRID